MISSTCVDCVSDNVILSDVQNAFKVLMFPDSYMFQAETAVEKVGNESRFEIESRLTEVLDIVGSLA